MRFTFLVFASRLPLSLPNSILYQVHPENFRCVPPKRSFPILQLSTEWYSLDLNFVLHNLGRFYFFRAATAPPRHTGWCRWSHDDIFHLARNRQGIFSCSRKTCLWTVQAFSSVCFFTFGTEENACSRWEFHACLHFIPHCPHSFAWHATCLENYKRLFLNKTQLFSAENILQSSTQCKNFSPCCLVTALRSVIS